MTLQTRIITKFSQINWSTNEPYPRLVTVVREPWETEHPPAGVTLLDCSTGFLFSPCESLPQQPLGANYPGVSASGVFLRGVKI